MFSAGILGHCYHVSIIYSTENVVQDKYYQLPITRRHLKQSLSLCLGGMMRGCRGESSVLFFNSTFSSHSFMNGET